VLASNPTGIVTLDPTGNNVRWRYPAPAACRLLGADAGSTGVVVVERCGDAADVQVRLLDGFAGSEHWLRELPAGTDLPVHLLGADGVVTVRIGNEVQTLAGPDGRELSRLAVPLGTTDLEQVTVGPVSLVRVDGTVTALETTSGATLWTAPAIGLPVTAAGAKDADRPAPVVLPDEHGFSSRDRLSGAELGRSAVAGLPSGGTVSTVGPVVVVRTDDRVLAYS
jgi:hypothetical protein